VVAAGVLATGVLGGVVSARVPVDAPPTVRVLVRWMLVAGSARSVDIVVSFVPRCGGLVGRRLSNSDAEGQARLVNEPSFIHSIKLLLIAQPGGLGMGNLRTSQRRM
jgi:hypothetical protein